MTDQRKILSRQHVDDFVNDALLAWNTNGDAGCPTSDFLSATMPRISPTGWHSAMGRRIVYWPQRRCDDFRVSILSSRLGKRKDLKPWWFDALRTALVRCDFQHDCVCVVDGTAPAEFVARGSELFGLRRLRMTVAKEPVMEFQRLIDWVMETDKAAIAGALAPQSELETRAFISPELAISEVGGAAGTRKLLVDQPLAILGERLVVLNSRTNGNVERIVAERLQVKSEPSPIVLLATATDAPSPSAKLIDAGGIAWWLDGEHQTASVGSEVESDDPVLRVDVDDGPLDVPDDWLCHWTRAAYGPWLDQPSDDFLDELILGCESADRSALAALMRMVSQRRILATVATAGEPPTVSFTAVPLAEFRRRRVFRKHRQRFDFEPWGVAVRKRSLIEDGCRAVEYIDSTPRCSPQASPDQQNFTQRRFDQRQTIDWSEEKEWRFPGTLQLDKIASDNLCYFVSTAEDANRLRRQCESRVIVVPSAAG